MSVGEISQGSLGDTDDTMALANAVHVTRNGEQLPETTGKEELSRTKRFGRCILAVVGTVVAVVVGLKIIDNVTDPEPFNTAIATLEPGATVWGTVTSYNDCVSGELVMKTVQRTGKGGIAIGRTGVGGEIVVGESYRFGLFCEGNPQLNGIRPASELSSENPSIP